MSSAWGEQPGGPAGADPWSVNAFDPPNPKVHSPAPHTREPGAPKSIPAQHELYVVQRHALDVLHDLRLIEDYLGGTKEPDRKIISLIQKLERDAENTYKVLRTWLKDHTEGDGGM